MKKNENPPGVHSIIHFLWLKTILAATQPVFTIKGMMYETETTPKQPINQLQNNDGHSGPEPHWLMTDAVWSGRGSREHNNHPIVAVLQSECTNLTSPMLTNGRGAAVMNATEGAALFKYTFLESQELTERRCQTCPNRWSHPLTSASSLRC